MPSALYIARRDTVRSNEYQVAGDLKAKLKQLGAGSVYVNPKALRRVDPPPFLTWWLRLPRGVDVSTGTSRESVFSFGIAYPTTAEAQGFGGPMPSQQWIYEPGGRSASLLVEELRTYDPWIPVDWALAAIIKP